MEDTLLTISEAARFLGVSSQTLRRWDASGRLRAIRIGTHRRYRPADLESVPGFRPSLFRLAKRWAKALTPPVIADEIFCANSAVFQTRLHRMETELSRVPELRDLFPLVVAVAGEIGNNSFDHNLGNWRDVPGVFFAYDLKTREIVLADRGQGVLTTLRRVLPNLGDDQEALTVAFSEVVSGRAPESRGNGLKFVRQVVVEYLAHLYFQSGKAVLRLKKGGEQLSIKEAGQAIPGCLARIDF